ncbi:hypothetical protein PC9H_008511 [Pleurotus ostreatus]|uniref:F-box domain-containing protein n=1 Tax=Pleurotus ostreatus TaxID=5322 RepID=A0A8H6ZVX4_PLEOS|nr:uncharacterized protein PC9H_008511 [Pleurotus ostreatus]KAF7426145.1 hypothetical protein PC9H_008511 [Pleurotus ostreatus]KAJ8693596.1 hypothetical protein PTI98_008577 [Pleurotus ostreatus]
MATLGSMSRTELPPEIWRHILSFLSEPYELLPICGVNRLFYDVAVDYRYRNLRMGFPSNSAVFKLRRARDPWLAKRVKSLYISTDAIELLFKDWSSFLLPSRPHWWNAILSLLPDAVLKTVAFPEPKPPPEKKDECTNIGAEEISNLILDAADGMTNIEKLEFHSTPTSELDFELEFMRLLCSRLQHLQTLTFWVGTDKVHLVLPVLQFCNLKKITLHIHACGAGGPAPSADACPRIRQFLRYFAPTLESLTVSTFDREVIERMSLALHDGAVMPRLRKLSIFLMINDIQAFQSINTNYPALTELTLTTFTPATIVSLAYLQLPELRSLTLWFRHINTTQGLWNGSSSFTKLETLHLMNGCELCPDEVAQLCRFFKKANIIDLMLCVYILDGDLIDTLALSFPSLSTLILTAQHVGRVDIIPTPDVDLASFEMEMQDRSYPEWNLSWVNVALPVSDWNNYTARMEAARMVTSIVTRCIPSMNKRGGDEEELL